MKILIAGDYAPIYGYEPLISGIEFDILKDLKPYVNNADIAILNLEVPVCQSGHKPNPKIGLNLRTAPQALLALKDAGFNLVNLANNHVLDYGLAGLSETINNCQKFDLEYIGAGRTPEEAYKPFIFQSGTNKIAIISAAEREFNTVRDYGYGAADIDVIRMSQQIQTLKDNGSRILVFLHAGNEYYPLPRPNLRQMAKYLVDQGADAVICSHIHVPGAYELHNGCFISYGLGNLIFDLPSKPIGWNQGYAVQFNCTAQKWDYEIIPYYQSAELNGVRIMKGRDLNLFWMKLDQYSAVLKNDNEYMARWLEFRDSKQYEIMTHLISPFRFRGQARIIHSFQKILYKLLLRFFLRKLNLVRCDSHREILIEVLKDATNPAAPFSDTKKSGRF